MNIIDLLIILILVFMAYRWYKVGLVRNLFVVVGTFAGIVIGVLVAPVVMNLFGGSVTKFIVAILIVSISTFAFGALGEAMGSKSDIRIQSKGLAKANYVAGGVASVFFGLFFVWLGAAVIVSSPFKAFNNQIENSVIIQSLNKNLPPTPPIIDRINAVVKPLDFPQVFSGVPQKLAEPVTTASSESVRLAVANAGKSTVKIEARGCGSLVSSGSGFVAGKGLIMTNAHVVAGSNSITVIDTSGSYESEAVYFDPAVDVAILKTPTLNAKTLRISSQIFSRGQEATILGFPGGGDFDAEPAGITRDLQARGLDIYSQNQITRSVYEFIGKVTQGNSGGPLVLSDGTVIGMVFASSENNPGYGYALDGVEISRALGSAGSIPVSTQKCYQ